MPGSPPESTTTASHRTQDPGARWELKKLGVGNPPPPGEAAFGNTQPCVYVGRAVVFAATVAVYSARGQDPPKSKAGPLQCWNILSLALGVGSHGAMHVHYRLSYMHHATRITVMLFKLFKKSIVFNLPVCLLFLLLKEKNITGVLRHTILPSPR